MPSRSDSFSTAGKLLASWLDQLGEVSDDAGQLTRTFLSPAMERANDLVAGWMREAGMTVREDAAGNLVGRIEPAGAVKPKTLLLGSHLDTVRNAGRFDGPLGVLLPIVALSELRRRGVILPFAIEIVGFSEEEGVRFGTAYLGSKAYVGQLTTNDLARCDAQGVSVRDAMEAWKANRASKPNDAITQVETTAVTAVSRRADLIGYVEVHIEQGPVLEARRLAVGTVSAIASQTRGRLTFRGKAGHAGTTPMNLRKDALAGAAEFIVAAEKFAKTRSPLVATVGTIQVESGASNVIPGETSLSLDVRHPNDARCKQAVAALVKTAQEIARRRGLRYEWKLSMKHRATPASKALTSLLASSVKAVQGSTVSLVSGAGHDGVVMATVTDIAMLFVRCRAGLSHHPDEYASPRDLSVALRVMVEFIERLAQHYRS